MAANVAVCVICADFVWKCSYQELPRIFPKAAPTAYSDRAM